MKENLIDSDLVERFYPFIEKVISSNYSKRGTELFRKCVKGWSKINVWNVWKDSFSKVEGYGMEAQ